MFRHKFSQTGIPHLLLLLLLIGLIIYVENSLQENVNEPPVISIASDNDDGFEELSSDNSDLIAISEKISLLLKLFTDDNDAFYAREKNPEVQSLTKQEKVALIVALARSFYVKHNYKNVLESLNEISYDERIKNDIQFIYAYSLSKTSKKSLAIKQYQLFIAHNSRSQAATLNLGILLKKEKLCNNAIPVFVKSVAISSGKKKAKGLAGLASCHYQLGHYEQAIKYYKKSIEYRPDSAQTWIALGRSFSLTNDNYEQALDAYNKGISLSSQDYKSYLLKAGLQIKHYDYHDALATLKSAQSLSNNAKNHEMMIWLYIEQNKRSKAKKHLTYLTKNALSKKQKKRAELLKLYVDKEYNKLISSLKSRKKLSDDMQYLKAIAYRKMGFYKSATTLFNSLSKNKEFGWRSKIQLARITRARKKYDEANYLYEKLLTKNPDASFLLFESALIHEKISQSQAGLLKINKAVLLQPENLVYKLVQARLLKLSGDLLMSITTLDSLLSQNPNYIRALRLKAELFAELNDTDNLIKTYEHLLDLRPDDYVTIEKLAGTLISLNKNQSAQELLSALLDEQSNNINARYLLADSYYKSNHLTQSLDELEKLLLLDKNNNQAKLLKYSIVSKIERY